MIDLECRLDLEPAGMTGSIEDTVDYHALVLRIQDLAAGQRFDLLETLAERIASLALEDERVEEVTVRAAKLSPPVGADVDSIGVEIHRRR